MIPIRSCMSVTSELRMQVLQRVLQEAYSERSEGPMLWTEITPQGVLYIELLGNRYDTIFKVTYTIENMERWEVVKGRDPPPGACRSTADFAYFERLEEVVQHIQSTLQRTQDAFDYGED